MTSTPHDALFKAAFERPEHAAELLQGLLPAPLIGAIDWTTLTRESGTFIDEKLIDRHTDLLFRAKLPDEDAVVYFYLLLEHQSTIDPDMPRRMLVYAMDYWAFHRKHRKGPLPIVFPVLICHVPGGWTAPTTMQALFHPSPDTIPGLAPFVPHLSMLVEDLSLRSNEDLRSLVATAFSVVTLWLLRDARDPARLLANIDHYCDAVAAVLQAPSGQAAFIQLLSYIDYVCGDEHYVEFRETICKQLPEAKEAVMTYAEKMIQQGREQGREEGREQGREQGREEGRLVTLRNVLHKQLTLKFGSVPPEHVATLDSARIEQLERYVERVLTAETLADVFAD